MGTATDSKTIEEMTREDFDALPHREWDRLVECDSIIILPMNELHESGYGCMDYVAVDVNRPICLLSGCSDIVHIEGIGGYGNGGFEAYRKTSKLIVPVGWNIDCLPKSGLLRLFSGRRMICGPAIGSFQVYSVQPGMKRKEA